LKVTLFIIYEVLNFLSIFEKRKEIVLKTIKPKVIKMNNSKPKYNKPSVVNSGGLCLILITKATVNEIIKGNQ